MQPALPSVEHKNAFLLVLLVLVRISLGISRCSERWTVNTSIINIDFDLVTIELPKL